MDYLIKSYRMNEDETDEYNGDLTYNFIVINDAENIDKIREIILKHISDDIWRVVDDFNYTSCRSDTDNLKSLKKSNKEEFNEYLKHYFLFAFSLDLRHICLEDGILPPELIESDDGYTRFRIGQVTVLKIIKELEEQKLLH